MTFLRDACTSLEKATRRFESRNVRHTMLFGWTL